MPNKQIFLSCKFSQRNRSFLHMIDPLVEHGYSVSAQQFGGKRFEYKDFMNNISSVRVVNAKLYEYLAEAFGITIKHLNKVQWMDKAPDNSILMSVDRQKIDGIKPHLGIPFQGQYLIFRSKILCGNFMSEAITAEQKKTKEEENTILIIHPGGARGVISPAFPHTIKRRRAMKNNVVLLSRLLRAIPSKYDNIILKTHPLPGRYCDADTIRKSIVPRLDRKISVVSTDLIQNICRAKFVINIGSSTVWWLLGGSKRWINIINCSLCDSSIVGRDQTQRAENWENVPNNSSIASLATTMETYDKVCLGYETTREGVKSSIFYRTPAVSTVLKFLKKF